MPPPVAGKALLLARGLRCLYQARAAALNCTQRCNKVGLVKEDPLNDLVHLMGFQEYRLAKRCEEILIRLGGGNGVNVELRAGTDQ